MTNMRVLHLTQYLEMGGLERVIYSLCCFNQDKGIETWVASFDQRPNAQSIKDQFEKVGTKTFTFQKKKGFSFRFIFKLSKLIYQNKISLIHTHDLGPLIYASILKLIFLNQIKIIHTQHSFVHLSKRARYRHYERFFTTFANQIVVISESARETYLKIGVNAKKMILIQNGASFPAQVPTTLANKISSRKQLAPHLDESRFWILYLARIHAQKGQIHALKLIAELSPEMKEKVVLVLVGQESSEGELLTLKKLSEELNLEKQVSFMGMSTEPQQWLSVSDLFLSLSEFEGMPLSPIEALGAGLPVVISDIPGHAMLPETCLRLSLPISKTDAVQFENKIAELFNETQAHRLIAFQAASELRMKYGIANMGEAYLKVYQRVKS